MKRLPIIIAHAIRLCASLFLYAHGNAKAAEQSDLIWGTSALTLAESFPRSPNMDMMLADERHTVSLSRFYRLGGRNAPATPTECRLGYDEQTLFVLFRCSEKDMAFPAMKHEGDWYAFLRSPSEQDALFPDKVDLFLAPNMNQSDYYQFAVTMDGQAFGVRRRTRVEASPPEEESTTGARDEKIKGFTATVTRSKTEWIVFLQIPWKTIGGKPTAGFGLDVARTRWREGEVSSPVAADFTERAPLDLFIETHFPGGPASEATPACLCMLPSGVWRWQRPALLTYPDAATLRQIPAASFAQRIFLAQRWTDLLVLEGFNFRPATGSIATEDLSAFLVRRKINHALRQSDTNAASAFLDQYLGKLDRVSRQWFADGSPGDTARSEWKAIERVSGIEESERVLRLHGWAGDRAVDLNLSLPESGGVRLWANAEGHFKPAALSALTIVRTPVKYSMTTSQGAVEVDENPLKISFLDAAGNAIATIQAQDIQFRFGPDGKVLAVNFNQPLAKDEVIYGFGEKYDHFNENGNVLTLWGVDDWNGLTAGLENQTYKPVPVWHSSQGWTVFDNSSYRLRADVGKTRQDEFRLTQHGPVFDYYFWTGSPASALDSYTALTGRPLLPPKWAFEPWMGRTGRGWSHTRSKDAVAEMERVVRRFADLDIPHSAIYAEGSGADSAAFHEFAAARGLRVLSWAYPAIPEKEQKTLLPGKTAAELPVLRTEHKNDSTNPINYVDFTNPNAKELLRHWWSRRLQLGVAGSMIDFGDRVPEDALFADGRKGAEMHNFYSYDYHRTDHEIFQEKRGDDFILFGRAAAPGDQQWAAQFGGDHPANFFGLQGVLRGALNLSACGFSTWGSDLGGFLGWPEPAVYMRWTQLACFSPLMRSHGRTPREPWEYGDAALANYKRCAWLRENLLDYVYSAALLAHQTGMPIMRSLAVAYPHELGLASVDDEYMFGPDLLVAPVTDEGYSRGISFPPGQWTSLWDGNTVAGSARVEVNAPLDVIPVFLREGAAVPVRLSTNLQWGQSLTAGEVHALAITPPTDKEDISIPISQSQQARVTMRPSSDGFSVAWQNLPETLTLLILGGNVTAATLDGESLPRRENGKIVAIQLPPGRAGREIQVTSQGRHAGR